MLECTCSDQSCWLAEACKIVRLLLQGEVAGFYSDYQNLLKDLTIYKQDKRWQADTPPHPIGLTAKENFDAVGKWLLPSGCVVCA